MLNVVPDAQTMDGPEIVPDVPAILGSPTAVYAIIVDAGAVVPTYLFLDQLNYT